MKVAPSVNQHHDTWNNSTRTLSWSGDGTNDVFDIQVDDTSIGFGSSTS